MAGHIKKPDKELAKWKDIYERSKSAYADERAMFDRRDQYYNGDAAIYSKDGARTKKDATNVRNIVYELVESQVDVTVPMPRVTPLHAEDKEVAKELEALMRNEVQRLRLEEMNDLQERTCPIHGGDFWLVEWDSDAGNHCTMGDVAVQELHPKQVIPQEGVHDLEKMDYFFVVSSKTKKAIQRQFDVDVSTLSETEPEIRENAGSKNAGVSTELVTQVDCYYRNGKGGIGRISWVDDVLLRKEEDYQQRKLEKCTKCGEVKGVCTCGSHSFREEAVEGFALNEDMQAVQYGGGEASISAAGETVYATNPDGSWQFEADEEGNLVLEDDLPKRIPVGTKKRVVPYYKPNCFPLVVRKNISKYGSFLGASDVDVISDQQEAIKKYTTKVQEKILKGGSFVTLPQGKNIETTDRDFKVIRLDNPAQRDLITVINVQPDISKEQYQSEVEYQAAKSELGITDSFQGKHDSSATSGTAKQFAANQSAGRLMSKRKMKYNCYARLYEMMFRFLMAYADEPIPYQTTDATGENVFAHFDPKKLIKVDAAGQPYWNDEFIFTVDEAATISSNRETLWNMADVKYQSGAFGPIGDLQSALILWTWLEATGYPGAGSVKRNIEGRLAMQQQAMAAGVPAMGDGIDGRTSVQQGDLTNLAAMGVF